jgi:penicillin-binding protein 1A
MRMARSGKRVEPTFDKEQAESGDLRAEPRPSPRARKSARKSAPERRSGSMIGALFYWALTLSIWGGVGVGALAVYYGSQLPPIDHLGHLRSRNVEIVG